VLSEEEGSWIEPLGHHLTTVMDFVFWRVIQTQVFKCNLKIVEDLKNYIEDAFADTDGDSGFRAEVISSIPVRLESCINVEDGHFEYTELLRDMYMRDHKRVCKESHIK
jgi:hypothetical protein